MEPAPAVAAVIAPETTLPRLSKSSLSESEIKDIYLVLMVAIHRPVKRLLVVGVAFRVYLNLSVVEGMLLVYWKSIW